MGPREVEFAVHGVAIAEPSGAFAVRGRVWADPLHVGDVFTLAEGPRQRWSEPSSTVADVTLRVGEIRFWRQLMDELEAPHAAELLLCGTGGDRLRDLMVLRTAA